MTDPIPREAQRAALLAEIPAEDLASFDAYYQAQLQQALVTANAAAHDDRLEADPDLVEEALITALIREADGRDHPDSLGLVPSRDGAYAIVPPDSDPRVAPPGGGTNNRRPSAPRGHTPASAMTPGRWLLVGALVLVPVLWLAWSLLPAADPTTALPAVTTTTTPDEDADSAATPTPLADVAGGEVTVAYPVSLEIARAGGHGPDVYRVLASAATLGGTWEPTLQPGVAAWLNGSYINHVLCFGPDAAPGLRTLERGATITMRPASGAVRRYTVIRTRQVGHQEVDVLDQRRAGLTLILCGQGDNTRTIVEAAYQPPQPAQPIVSRGQPASIPDLARFTVQTVQTLSPTTTIPTGYAEVELTVQVDNQTEQVWTSVAVADQLLIGGMVAEAAGITNDAIDAHASRRVTYRYLVPVGGGAATWRVTAPSGETIAVAVTIPPAPSGIPPAAHTATLDSAGVRLEPTRSGQTIRVPFTIQATGDDPVLLPLSAAQIWIGGRSLPLSPATVGLPTTVEPLTPTTIILAADLPDVSQLEIQLGTQHWRLTLP